MSERMPILERFGLHRPELRAWAMYDWANSAFILVIVTAVFPIYYEKVAAAAGLESSEATKWLSYSTTAALLCVALFSPVLGAIADYLGAKKRMLAIFVVTGSVASSLLFFVHSGQWVGALVLFAIGNASIFLSFVFYDSLLPHIAKSDEELDRVSTAGYAVGYLGSGLLLVAIIALVQNPGWLGLADAGAATRVGFLAVGLWWAVFSLPLFLRVPEPPRQIEADETSAASAVGVALDRLKETASELRGSYKEAFKMLVAYMIYNEGIGTIIRMGGIYAVSKSFPEDSVIIAILLIQFAGIPFAFLFGSLGPLLGTKRTILLGVTVYAGISIVAYRMETITEFYVMAALVAMVQGGTQGLSRSLFGTLIPKHKASEFFGFFSVFAKVAGIFGPLVFGLVIEATGSLQQAILSVILFFIVGGILLARVDVDRGQKQAEDAEARLLAEEDA
ncbi:MAG: MFS transporter [Holophagales bacterium]|nr:MFS transporter [Holophagales bacterium]